MTIKKFFLKSNLPNKIILIIYIFSFTGAACNHIIDLIKGGLFPYTRGNVPFILNLYWTSLTLLDPLSIGILFLNIRTGLWFYLLIMISDVAINLFSNTFYWKVFLIYQPALLMQMVFLLFFIITFKRIYKSS